MRFKYLPEDFIVEEIPNYEPNLEGNFFLYKLTKTNVGSIEALRSVLEKNSLDWREVSWAGLKDKQAITIQYFTLSKDIGNRFETQGIIVEKVGKRATKLQPGDLEKNQFTITLRELSAEQAKKIPSILASCTTIPNYFDTQRFGSCRHNKGFVAKQIILKNYEEALKLHMAVPGNDKNPKIARAKEFIAQHWGDWDACLQNTPPFLWDIRRVLTHLQQHPDDLIGALKKIEKKMRVLYVFAYQSYIFNEMLSEYIKSLGEYREIPYILGTLTFPIIPLPVDETMALASKDALYPDHMKAAAEKIIAKEGFENIAQIRMPKQFRETFFKANLRPIAYAPSNIQLLETADDEHFPGMKKAKIAFTLPKGSYATLVLKQIEALL